MNKEKNVGVSPLLGVPNGKLGFMIKDGSVTIKKLAAEVLNLIYSGGGQGGAVQLVDLSDRMTEDNDAVTDMEIKTALFLYDVYNRVSAIARVVEPKSNTRYALFKVSYYDDISGENKMAYIAYTTEDDFSSSATWHYNRILNANDTLYPWAMSVFGDAVIDSENDLLIVGNNKYELERYIEEPTISYVYSVPEITQFTYPVISADGDTVYPTVKFLQAITKTIDYGTRTDTETYTLTGTVTHDGITYSNKSLVIKDAVAIFTGNNPYQQGGIDAIGAVKVDRSDVASVRKVRTVTATLSVNDESSAGKDADVMQSAATMDASASASIASTGGQDIVSINKTSGVYVEFSDVNPSVRWIVVDAVTSENKKVSVKYTVSANTGLSERTGTITVSSDVAGLQCVITVTQSAAQAVISVDSNSVNFGQQYIGDSYTQEVTVFGTNVRGNVVVSNKAGTAFIVSPSSITAAQANAATGYKLTVTYTPTSTGSHTGSFTLSSTGADNVVVNLRGTGVKKPSESYTGYYGVEEKRNGTPQLVESQNFVLGESNSTAVVKVSDVGRKAWIAIPTSIDSKVTVTGKDTLGNMLTLEETTIGSYKYYYRSAVGTFFDTEFTIVYNS